jgi:hypothetical protein
MKVKGRIFVWFLWIDFMRALDSCSNGCLSLNRGKQSDHDGSSGGEPFVREKENRLETMGG